GNRDVQPERWRQLNVGAVFEPLQGLSASADYYRVEIRDLISIVPIDAIQGDFARWAPTMVVRHPPDAEYPGLPGPIDYVVQTLVNAGKLQTSGIDVDLRYRFGLDAWGRVALGFTGTYILDYSATDFASASPGRADPLGNG